MQGFPWRHVKHGALMLLLLVAAAGWLCVIYAEHRSNEPIEVAKRHFVFYPQYSHGVWREEECASDKQGCREVTYTISVQGCGPVKFHWRVFPGEDADTTWSYNGTSPKFDEEKYPLYAILNQDSRFIDSPALGKPVPQTCQAK